MQWRSNPVWEIPSSSSSDGDNTASVTEKVSDAGISRYTTTETADHSRRIDGAVAGTASDLSASFDHSRRIDGAVAGTTSDLSASFGKVFSCVSYSAVALIIVTCVGFLVFFTSQYVQIRGQCIDAWGPAIADWCSVKVYHPYGLLRETSCGCRVITVPQNGLEKTLPAEVFEKLGSNVTLAVVASYSNLIGPIPDAFDSMYNVKLIHMVNNKLSGPIPPSLADKLVSVQFLSFAGNTSLFSIFPLLSCPFFSYSLSPTLSLLVSSFLVTSLMLLLCFAI